MIPAPRTRNSKAWYFGWRVVQRGSSKSGNWGHKGVKGKRGGSAPGGGHGAIGITPAMSTDEIQAAVDAQRARTAAKKGKKKAPGPRLRKQLERHVANIDAQIEEGRKKRDEAWRGVRYYEDTANGMVDDLNRYKAAGDTENYDRLRVEWEVASEGRKRFLEEYERLNREVRELNYQRAKGGIDIVAVPEDQRATVKMTTKVRKGRAEAQKGLDVFNKLCGTGTVNGQKVEVKRTDRARSFYRDKVTRTYAGVAGGEDITVTAGGGVHLSTIASAKTMIHELGHWLEDRDPKITQRVQGFLARRTAGETAQKLSVLTGDSRYKDYEVAKPDQFQDAYVGKQYGIGSEVISMGLQYLYSNAADFAKKDPDYFDFMISVLRGQ